MQAPFEHLVTAHGRTVLRVARALAGPDDADDVWSETFLAALCAYPELPETANTEAWLVTIAHRKAIDALRARGRRPVPVEPGASLRCGHGGQPAAAGAHGDPGGRADALDLYDALARLPAKQRRAVALHHLGGLPHAQVAEQLGGTAVAARRAAADGVAALRRHLAVPEGGRNDR